MYTRKRLQASCNQQAAGIQLIVVVSQTLQKTDEKSSIIPREKVKQGERKIKTRGCQYKRNVGV